MMMNVYALLLGVTLTFQAFNFSQGYYINIDGQVRIAGLFNVHSKGNAGKNYWIRCGTIQPQHGLMFVEAMLFAIDQINKNSSFLYGLKLAARIHDTCGDRYYLRNAIVNIARYNSQGIIGPQYSDSAQSAATVFDIFGKSVISYSATSPDLENRNKYRYFYRTVPSDRKMAKLMVNIALKFKWRYVAVVSSFGNYGERLSSMFKEYANKQEICTPVVLQIAEEVKENDIKYIMESIIKHKTINVVYLFLTDTHVKQLFQYTDKVKEKYEYLSFVIGDGLAGRVTLTKGKPLANGSLTVQVAQDEVPEFRDYFLKLRPENNTRNIWFQEFWEENFNCSIRNDSSKPRVCNGNEKLSVGNGYYKNTPVLSVINAVYVYAHAFRKVLEEKCISRNKTAVKCYSEGMLYGLNNYRDILTNVRNVRFKEPFRERIFQFDYKGEYNEDYAIFNLYMNTNGNRQQFEQVGLWNNSDNGMMKITSNTNAYDTTPSPPETWRLSLNTNQIKWKYGQANEPTSVCSEPCKFGEVRMLQNQKTTCCWTCVPCLDNEIIKNNTCVLCHADEIPDKTRTKCQQLPVRFPSSETLVRVTVISLTSLGLLMTIFVIALFVKHFNRRIIKASGRELCLNMLIGIAITYLAPIAFIIKPSNIICSSQRFIVGLSLTISYAPLLLKTNRIYRIFRSAKTTVERPVMVSPKSQILMSLALTAIQMLIGLVSITGSAVRITSAYPNHREYTLQFCDLSKESVFMNLSFSTALMIATTWFAFKTRNFPKNYNEAKYIGFTMYTTCLVLAVFLPIFYFVDDKEGRYRMVIMCCVCEIVATINIIGLFSNRVKLILCKNQRSIDTNLTTMHSSFSPSHVKIQRVAVNSEKWIPAEISASRDVPSK